MFSKLRLDFKQFYQKRNSKYLKTTNFNVSYSLNEKILFNMIKNWRFVQPRRYDCDPSGSRVIGNRCKSLASLFQAFSLWGAKEKSGAREKKTPLSHSSFSTTLAPRAAFRCSPQSKRLPHNLKAWNRLVTSQNQDSLKQLGNEFIIKAFGNLFSDDCIVCILKPFWGGHIFGGKRRKHKTPYRKKTTQYKKKTHSDECRIALES